MMDKDDESRAWVDAEGMRVEISVIAWIRDALQWRGSVSDVYRCYTGCCCCYCCGGGG